LAGKSGGPKGGASGDSPKNDPSAEIKLNVHGVLSDPNTEAQIVILRDERDVEILPIWVGINEGNAIRFALEGIVPPRPLTHDLLRGILEQLGSDLVKVVISDMNNGTYFSTLHLVRDGNPLTVDARPSDAIALALRAHVPIYVSGTVLKKKSNENLDAWLEKLKPKDFGQSNA
jgi:bifunctional DNase/RNase